MTSQALCETVTTIYVALLDALGDDRARRHANGVIREAIAHRWVSDPNAVRALEEEAEPGPTNSWSSPKGNVIAVPRRPRMQIIASYILRKRNIANAYGN
jgi:hypothetical protein